MSLKTFYLNNIYRRRRIKSAQSRYIDNTLGTNKKNMIIFIVPDRDEVNGGIMSIISLSEETKKLVINRNSAVIVCTMPGALPLLKYTKFENQATIVSLDLLLSKLPWNDRVFIHVPDLYVKKFTDNMLSLFRDHPNTYWSFNILLQNIDYMPDKKHVDLLKKYGKVTCTTAHKAYSNSSTEALIGCNIHHFSVYISPEKYIFKPFIEKENIIVVSPDNHPRRDEILSKLKKGMNNFEFITVSNMTYEQYKNLISRAKYSLTFGEGLDGYFVETIFSGGVGTAVFNNRFFTDEYEGLPFIYQSWDDLLSKFPDDTSMLNNNFDFKSKQAIQFSLLASYYSHEKYVQNLVDFYEQCDFLT